MINTTMNDDNIYIAWKTNKIKVYKSQIYSV